MNGVNKVNTQATGKVGDLDPAKAVAAKDTKALVVKIESLGNFNPVTSAGMLFATMNSLQV